MKKIINKITSPAFLKTLFGILALAFVTVLFIRGKNAMASDYKLTDSDVFVINTIDQTHLNKTIGNKIKNALFAGKEFKYTVDVTSALLTASSGTLPLTIVPDTETVGASVYLTGFKAKVDGPANWKNVWGFQSSSFTFFQVQDSSGNNFLNIISSSLFANNYITETSTGVTLGRAFYNSTGSAQGFGLQLITNSTSNLTGSDFWLTLTGYIY